MARRVKTFWSKSRTQQIKREIANYNKRIRRAAKNNPSITDQLPQTIKLKDIKEQITSSKEYNKLRTQMAGARAETLRLNSKGKLIYNSRFRNQLEIIRNPKLDDKALLVKYASEIENDEYKGRFPTDRQFIKRQIGIEAGNIKNYDRIHEFTQTKPGFQRASLWRDNYLRVIDNAIDANLIMGNKEGVELLNQLRNFIDRLPIENFIIGQLREPGYLAISNGLLRYFRAGSAPAEDELEELNAEISRLVEEWDKYDI